ncbi:MAG TPA: Crp/Fnr family transcriptional regulator [Chryseosolibacter sp.]
MSQPILNYISRYIQLDAEEEKYFLSILRSRKYLKRQFVVQAGDECKYETYVVKGCLKAYFVDPDGNSHIIQFAVEDWWISDMDSLMNGTPATFNIDAVEDTEVLQIERTDFNTLFERIPKFNVMYRTMLMKAFVAHQRRIVDNLCKPAKDRYLDFVKRYRNIEQRVPQHQIASYLGMTPEFLSQIRRKLADS